MTGFDLTVVAILAGIWLACGIGGIVILIGALRRPESDKDRRLARIDVELRRREGRVP